MAERATHAVDLTVGPEPTQRIDTRAAPARPLTEAATSPDRRGPGAAPPDDRRGLPARAIIVGWVLLLMLGVLVLVNVVTREGLLRGVDEQVAGALTQESTEFARVAAAGVNRSTEQPYADIRELLNSHLQRQFPDDDEVMVGVLPDGSILRQDRVEPIPVAERPERIREIVDAPNATGALRTDDGELRWRKVTVVAADGGPPGTFVVGYAVDRDRAEVTATMSTLVLVSMAGLLLAGAGAFLVSGQILVPVRLVRQAAAEINERDLTRRIPVHGRDDISALAEQFNAMLDRLDIAFCTQRRFVDDASHELRTPITIVRGHLELMETGAGSGAVAARTETVRLVTDELDRMSRIVEDLLLLAKAQRPDFVRFAEVSVAELTSDVDAKVRALGDRRWILEAIGEGTAVVDQQRVTQAMVQLAQNAAAHTGVGDEIRMGSALHPDDAGVLRVSFWVTDTGPGVRPEDAHAIFERFSRGSTGGARPNRTGAGLGLAIVRAIADAHGGSVRLVSDPGVGATFGIELPARPAPNRSAPNRSAPNRSAPNRTTDAGKATP